MRFVSAGILILALATIVTAQDKAKDALTKSAKEIGPQPQDGTWKAIAGVIRGSKLTEEELKAITLVIHGDTYTVLIENEQPDKGIGKPDHTTSPKRLTLKGTEGPNKDRTMLAIFEMKDADSLRVCYDLSGKEYPREFMAPRDSSLFVMEYRRAKEPTADKK